MKQILTLTFCLVVLHSCKKVNLDSKTSYLQSVRNGLQDSLNHADYSALDFSKAILSEAAGEQIYLRIPFKGKTVATHFVLLITNKDGFIWQGKIITLQGGEIEYRKGLITRRTWEGSITIQSLQGKDVLESFIQNGYINAFHENKNRRVSNLEPEGDVLPEIIVVASVRESGISYSDWMYLNSFFRSMAYDSGEGGGGYYGSFDGGGGTSSGSAGETGTEVNGEVQKEELMQVDIESYVNKGSIELEKYLKCFENIPDAGAVCSIEIFADIPVDNDPDKLFDWSIGSPGHTFLQIKKSNGGDVVQQTIGFYPASGWKVTLTNAPVAGKFVDNGGHEFNASIKMNLSADNFKSVLTEILYLRNSQYDLDEFNCTDFALNVFNKVRTNKLEIPLYHVPGTITAAGSSTPQGLYNRLKEMQHSGDPESGNIKINIIKGWVGSSNGVCN